MHSSFTWLDYTVVVGYLLALVAVASVFMKEKSAKDFFVASGKIPWWAAGMSILATLVSAIGITSTYADFSRYGFEGFGLWWLATFLAIPIISVVIRFYLRSGVGSAYEYLEKRFGVSVRLMGCLFFMACRGLYMGVVLYASAIILEQCTGGAVSIPAMIVFTGVFSIVYAVIGGIKGVIWTDVLQLIVMYLGIGWILVMLMQGLDWDVPRVWQVSTSAGHDFSYLSNPKFWSLDIFEPNACWILLLGFVFHAVAQKSTDQLTVQRYLTTGDYRASIKAMLVDVIGGIPLGLIMTGIGMTIFVWYELNPQELEGVSDNEAFIHYVVQHLPSGISGLVVASIMAAVISTVDSCINCLATVTMVDLHQRFRKNPFTDRESLRWARTWTVVWGCASILFSLFIYYTALDTISRVSTQVLGLFAGAILGTFILGMFTERASRTSTIIGAVAGSLAAIYVNYFVTSVNEAGEVRHVSYVVPMIVGTVVTLVLGYACSWFFPNAEGKDIANLTIWTQRPADVAKKEVAHKEK